MRFWEERQGSEKNPYSDSPSMTVRFGWSNSLPQNTVHASILVLLHGRTSTMPIPSSHRARKRFLFLALNCLFGLASTAQAQHSMPIPACPGRGLVTPGTDGMWYLDGCYGCQLDGTNAEEDDLSSPHLLPDFLHEYKGIAAEYVYTGEVFSIAHGGLKTKDGTKYRGNLDLVLNADTTAMDLWEGGRFFIYGNGYHGQALTNEFVGDSQFYSNIDSTPPRRENEFLVMEYWYEHSFADGDILVNVGKQDSNADFAYTDLGGDFLNASFGFSPTILLPSWPNPAIGVASFLNLTDVLHYKVGVYDGSPSQGAMTGGRSGFDSLGDGGVMTMQELSLTPQFGADGELPGTYKAGVWIHSSEFDNLETGVGTLNGNHGYWFVADQMLWIEPGCGDEPQGLGIFYQHGWSPSDRNAVDRYNGTGVTYRGLVTHRDVDLVGVGLASAHFSAAGTNRENAIELFYKAQLTEFITVQPDLVYIANPSGVNNDAFLVGLRSEIVF